MGLKIPNIFSKPPVKKLTAKQNVAAYQQPSMQSFEKDTPLNAAAIKYAREGGYGAAGEKPGSWDSGVYGVRENMRAMAGTNIAPPAPIKPPSGTGTGKSGGGGRGGGGSSAAQLAQAQLDFLLPILGSKSYTAAPETGVRDAIGQRQQGIATATQGDLATAGTAWDNLDTYLRGNQANPYANVQLQRAPTSPDYNPYLESQGVQPLNRVDSNPQDPYGGFQNVLALLAANQAQQYQSQQAGSQMGRAASVTGINAMDNSFQDAIRQQLAQLAQQEYTNQQALDKEKRDAVLQLAPLLGAGAVAPPDLLAQLGMS
jgi:hypothetical protein